MTSESSASFLSVRVIPNASRNEVVGWQGEVLKIKVQAPPEGGRANQEVFTVLANALGVRRKCLSIEQGAIARTKRIRIADMTAAELESALKRHT